MIKKTFALCFFLVEIAVGKNIICNDRVTAFYDKGAFGSMTIYTKQFQKNEECVGAALYLLNKSPLGNQKFDLHDNFQGWLRINTSGGSLIMIQTSPGGHSNAVTFFLEDDETERLSRVENGDIGTDQGVPSLYIDSDPDILLVSVGHMRSDKINFYFTQDTLQYDPKNKKFFYVSKDVLLRTVNIAEDAKRIEKENKEKIEKENKELLDSKDNNDSDLPDAHQEPLDENIIQNIKRRFDYHPNYSYPRSKIGNVS